MIKLDSDAPVAAHVRIAAFHVWTWLLDVAELDATTAGLLVGRYCEGRSLVAAARMHRMDVATARQYETRALLAMSPDVFATFTARCQAIRPDFAWHASVHRMRGDVVARCTHSTVTYVEPTSGDVPFWLCDTCDAETYVSADVDGMGVILEPVWT